MRRPASGRRQPGLPRPRWWRRNNDASRVLDVFGDFLGGAILGIAEGAGAGETLVAAGDVVGDAREGRAGHHRFVGGDLDQIVLRIDAERFAGRAGAVLGSMISEERLDVNLSIQPVERRRADGGAVELERQRVADLDLDPRFARRVGLVDRRQRPPSAACRAGRCAVGVFGIHRLEAAGGQCRQARRRPEAERRCGA